MGKEWVCLFSTWMVVVTPLRPNNAQHQFSPNDIHTLSRDTVVRINQINDHQINRKLVLWSFIIKLSQLILNEMYEYQCGEFVCGYWGLKG